VCLSLHGWLGVSMYPAMARLIFLATGLVPDFAAGPQSHNGAAVLALFPAHVWGLIRIAGVLPRRHGIVQAGSGAWAAAVNFLSGHVVATVLIFCHGS